MIKNLINKIIILLKQKDDIMGESVEIKQRAKPGPKPKNNTELETKVQNEQNTTHQSLYLVEGLVELNSASGLNQKEQQRIVWASNVPEAMEKFSAYFSSLNTESAVYTVVNMFVSEAIN